MNLPADVLNFLKSALDEDIDNYIITTHSGNNKGDGFLGEIIFISLQHKTTKENKHWIVKRSVEYDGPTTSVIQDCFHNEIKFYTKIFKSFVQLQKTVPDMELFDKIPECYAVSSAKGDEKLLLGNLKFSGFEVFDKKKPFDKEHMELAFKTYGKFHGISFAFKELNPEENCALIKNTPNIIERFIEIGLMQGTQGFFKLYLEHNNIANNKLKLILENYAKNGNDIFANVNKYHGKNGIILHGDCWSNNMLFKYNAERKPIDIRLLDFQLIKSSSPVFDLSYCFYTSGSEELFIELEYYLKIYHESLSATLKHFGLNSEKIYSFESLKNEWEQYSKFGVIMGMYLWSVKLIAEHKVKNIQEYQQLDNGGEGSKDYFQQFFEIPEFNKLMDILIFHSFEKNLL